MISTESKLLIDKLLSKIKTANLNDENKWIDTMSYLTTFIN
jgi:hypothetical protein